MTLPLSSRDLARIRHGYHPDPSRSFSLAAEAYTDEMWYRTDLEAVFARTWQWVCHVEKLRTPGSYFVTEIAGRPIAVVRDREGVLRAFYNVCKHRAHHLLTGEGETTRIMCPYHAWVYDLK